MPMNTKKWLLLGFSAFVLLVLVLIFFFGGGREKIRPLLQAPAPAFSPEPSSVPETKMVTLFFLSEDDNLLHPEVREIGASSSVVREAEQTIEALLKGSEKGYLSPLPPETKLRQLYITKEGVAYVDFTKHIMDAHPSGSSAEMATIYSIVNSLAFNFKLIKRVSILVEGGERETLGGHINLSKPFLPLYSLNAE